MVLALPTTAPIPDVHAAVDKSDISPAPADVRRIVVYLIKPSRYDDDGYVVRHWRGVLPSNTLACLDALTHDVAQRRLLGEHVWIETRLIDETVEKVRVRQIVHEARRGHARVIVGLVGVQTNQFSRARDLAVQLRAADVTVMIGGFHVSGVMAMFPDDPPDIAGLVATGTTVVAGEVEDYWAKILSDAVNDRLRPVYNLLTDPPDLSTKPVPRTSKAYMKRFAMRHLGTIDAGRGCPFSCTFCTIINVQGRKMRCRDASHLRSVLQANHREGITHYFFTDDNFSRNKNWRPIFEELIEVRALGYDIGFMMQVDTISYKTPDFVELARRAGCSQVFIGMESINAENLQGAGKGQNDVSDYGRMATAWRDAGIVTHVGYIIGFPFDTRESVREDVRRLAEDIRVDQASFFMLTPLPGSVDHKRMVETGVPLDADHNSYDSFHTTMRHARMSAGDWVGAYRDAWRDFYSVDRMKASLRRSPRRTYWNTLINFLWYKHSVVVDDAHPMVTGFLRMKGRHSRRPEMSVERLGAYWRGRLREVARDMRLRFRLMLELQEVWLQTRRRTDTELLVADFLNRVARKSKRARLRLVDWQEAFGAAHARVPSRLRLLTGRLNPLSLRWTYTRQDLANFWEITRSRLRRGALYRINWLRVAWNITRDMTITARFALALARGV